jgi:hypothetical protein
MHSRPRRVFATQPGTQLPLRSEVYPLMHRSAVRPRDVPREIRREREPPRYEEGRRGENNPASGHLGNRVLLDTELATPVWKSFGRDHPNRVQVRRALHILAGSRSTGS